MSKRIVIATITMGVLAGLIYWRYQEGYSPQKAREAVLRQDLYSLRFVIDQYTSDMHRRPQTLQDLVTTGYLKEVPVDPMTGRNSTWLLVAADDPKNPGIDNVHSGSDNKARDGTMYRDW